MTDSALSSVNRVSDEIVKLLEAKRQMSPAELVRQVATGPGNLPHSEIERALRVLLERGKLSLGDKLQLKLGS